jgi:hypothetical protein
MALSYNPLDWYWIVAGDESRVFSSKTGDYVQLGDAAYVAWLALGGVPTRIISEAELGEVLAPHSIRPVRATVLDAYKDEQARKLTVETVAKIAFNHENRIRVLEGKQPINANQFRQALKDLM